jgi:hypothetical protein
LLYVILSETKNLLPLTYQYLVRRYPFGERSFGFAQDDISICWILLEKTEFFSVLRASATYPSKVYNGFARCRLGGHRCIPAFIIEVKAGFIFPVLAGYIH